MFNHGVQAQSGSWVCSELGFYRQRPERELRIFTRKLIQWWTMKSELDKRCIKTEGSEKIVTWSEGLHVCISSMESLEQVSCKGQRLCSKSRMFRI